MANIKSQKKRNITNAKRAERNKAARSELKTSVGPLRSRGPGKASNQRLPVPTTYTERPEPGRLRSGRSQRAAAQGW